MLFFRLLARLPLSFLHSLSTFLSVVLHRLIRYRRTVIEENLRQSFPEKTSTEIQAITKAFYLNFTDLIVETIKLPGLKPDELQKRMVCLNTELPVAWFQRGLPVLVMTSHTANWEWTAPSLVLHGLPSDSIYKTLSSSFSNDLMQIIRSRFGAVPVSMKELPRRLVAAKNTPRLIGMVADQVPDIPEYAYWTDFLHRDTPFYPGSERLARSRNLPVIYADLRRVKRGYYELTFRPLAEPPYTDLPLGTIIDRYRDQLETTIRAKPSDWLWSHKRWKHWRGKYSFLDPKLT
jgi:KDO2-lipid IV(A) lauroyltransferase